MSHHLTPFYVSEPARAFLPIKRNQEGQWVLVTEETLTTREVSVNQAFKIILKEIGFSLQQYFEMLNYRNKLVAQVFPNSGFLVLAGAGGSYTCAGYVNLSNCSGEKIIVDQTLYWYIASSEEEAIYITGLLNSMALDVLISEFQPEGLQGRRHIHKLPYVITPKYDPENDSHKAVVETTKQLLLEWNNTIKNTPSISKLTSPSTSNISVRRRNIRSLLQQLSSYQLYEEKCREVYCVVSN
jgi:hypothetical protein